jgi:5-(aminomethyl)-3-furanmethanol phosphate kinase
VIVVKLGGSLAEAESLRGWLDALESGRGRAVVVPGGGVFADAVRGEQRQHGFSDRAAHGMALLAMEQYALMLADLAAALVPSRTLAEMRDALDAGAVPVWLPATMACADASIPPSWEVASDSLAAWLGRQLEAARLVLVKSVAAPAPLDAAVLAARGMVDRAFPSFLAESRLALDWVGPGEEERLARLLAA